MIIIVLVVIVPLQWRSGFRPLVFVPHSGGLVSGLSYLLLVEEVWFPASRISSLYIVEVWFPASRISSLYWRSGFRPLVLTPCSGGLVSGLSY